MLDRLRESALDDGEDDDDFEAMAFDDTDFVETSAGDNLILGLTPAQRLILSIFLFLTVTTSGCALLLALGRINPPF